MNLGNDLKKLLLAGIGAAALTVEKTEEVVQLGYAKTQTVTVSF